MGTRTRGLITFLVIIFVAVVFCGWFPFVFAPNNGIAVALPVIEVPGEVVIEDFLPDFNLTNTIIGTVLADLLLLALVIIGWRVSKGWTKRVPGRIQGLIEVMVSGLYNFFEGLAGDRLRTAPLLWPLVATIFFFLLMANMLKLFPGVETVGKMHCAYVGQSGYAMVEGWTDTSYRLWVDEPLNAGTTQTEASYEVCTDFFDNKEFKHFDVESPEAIEALIVEAETGVEEARAELEAAETVFAELEAEFAGEEELSEEQEEELEEAEHIVEEALANFEAAERAVERQIIRLDSAQAIQVLNTSISIVDAELGASDEEAEEGAEELAEVEEDHAEEFTLELPGFESFEPQATYNEFTTGLLEDATGEVEAALTTVQEAHDEEEYTSALEELDGALSNLRNFYITQMEYPTATQIFTEEQLETDAKPFIFHITPFVRGAATDLSLAFALAIMSIVVVQVYGVWALGPAYFEKFINISALGNLGKRPLGAIDFVVGLIEIISEIGKIVSLAFRLFGNLFAGGVALMAVSFLVSMLIPGVIYGLEVIIGTVQALVFAVLTLVFSVQAMEAHHGDEHGEEHH